MHGRVGLAAAEAGDGGDVIDGRQLAAEALLDGIVVVQLVHQRVHDVGLLVGEIHHLGKVGKGFAKGGQPIDVAGRVHLLHGEARLLESVQIAVHRAAGSGRA